MKFGENLKKLRKNKNLSQEQLAEKVNVTRQSVSIATNSIKDKLKHPFKSKD